MIRRESMANVRTTHNQDLVLGTMNRKFCPFNSTNPVLCDVFRLCCTMIKDRKVGRKLIHLRYVDVYLS